MDGTFLKTKIEESFLGSPNIFLNNHIFLRTKNSLIIQTTIFHYKELFVEWTHGCLPKTLILSVYLIWYKLYFTTVFLSRSFVGLYIIDYVIFVFLLDDNA